jgi:hypothetical protein
VNCLHRLTNSQDKENILTTTAHFESDLIKSLQKILLSSLDSKKFSKLTKKRSDSPNDFNLNMENVSTSIFRFKIELKDIKPLVWRRIEIECDTTFESLHEAIQEAFGWSGMHLHDFTFRNPDFFNKIQRIDGIPPTRGTEFDDGLDLEGDFQEDKVKLHEIFALGIKHVIYTYDFGDNWEHKIIFEGTFPRDQNEIYPRVIKSKGDSPEEDSRCC